MGKGLGALKHLYAKLSCKSTVGEIDEIFQEYEIIEKELKALEIIRKHCHVIQKGILPKAKQDLLDEVLLCH